MAETNDKISLFNFELLGRDKGAFWNIFKVPYTG